LELEVTLGRSIFLEVAEVILFLILLHQLAAAEVGHGDTLVSLVVQAAEEMKGMGSDLERAVKEMPVLLITPLVRENKEAEEEVLGQLPVLIMVELE